MTASGPLLVAENLTVRVGSIEVVHQLNLALEAGQRTGLIGESGSGKTLTALAIMGLLPDGLSASGSVRYRERDLLAISERELCAIRGDRVAMIFQEPMTAFNPVMKIGEQVAEPLRLHRHMPAGEARATARQDGPMKLEFQCPWCGCETHVQGSDSASGSLAVISSTSLVGDSL